MLRDVETVIVDEIHAVADDKRGAHLALSLERLEALTPRPPGAHRSVRHRRSRSKMVAQFLTGDGRPDPVIVNIGHKREIDLAVEVPRSELGPVAINEMWDEIYDRAAPSWSEQHRSTLVFVNTRRLAERVAHHLGERLGEDNVAGAPRQPVAQAAARRREAGSKRARSASLVATASLELGIDIGTVDLVMPDRFAALHRGRAAARRPRRSLARRRCPRDAFSPLPAMICSNAPRWCVRFGTANSIG